MQQPGNQCKTRVRLSHDCSKGARALSYKVTQRQRASQADKQASENFSDRPQPFMVWKHLLPKGGEKWQSSRLATMTSRIG